MFSSVFNFLKDVFFSPLGQMSPEHMRLSETIFFNGAIPVAVALVAAHLFLLKKPRKDWPLTNDLILIVFFGALLAFLVLVMQSGQRAIHFRDIVSVVILFGAVVFVTVSELLLRGLSTFLTRKRGEKWVKELDYVYLLLASIGLLASINRLGTISDPIGVPDFYGPMLVAAALAIRAIKTRADIGGWNKL